MGLYAEVFPSAEAPAAGPVTLIVNGQAIEAKEVSESGSTYSVSLKKGFNEVRLSGSGPLPVIDCMMLQKSGSAK